MDSYKLAVKFFIEDPSKTTSEELVPVFHRWIQSRALPDHQLIDVATYGHVYQGPGIVLVSHEANIHADQGEGRPGLLYIRKAPLPGSFPQRLAAVFRYALTACAMLENDPALEGRIKFVTDRAVFRINDRLLGPNTPQTYAEIKDDLKGVAERLWDNAPIELSYEPDAERLFEVGIRSTQAAPLSALLNRATAAT